MLGLRRIIGPRNPFLGICGRVSAGSWYEILPCPRSLVPILVSVRKLAIEIARNFVDDVEKFSGVSVNRERFTNPLSATI
jgi:hypothetical protein